jgi:hypothetical protein
LILKRAVDYINILQSQIKDTKHEVEDLKRRNENLVQQASGLKPFLTSLQLQQSAINNVAQQMPTTSASFLPAGSLSKRTFIRESKIMILFLASGLALYTNNGNFCQTSSASPQCESANSSPITPLQNTSLLANLLLQNPNLLAQLQLQQQQNANLNFEPLTPPSSASNQPGGLIYATDAQARLLASTLAIKERQYAAVAATQL